MSDLLKALLKRDDVTPAPPASRADIDAVCDAFSAPMPELHLRLWLQSDGVGLDRLDAHLMDRQRSSS